MRELLQRMIRRHLLKMDIHPGARIAVSALIDRTYPAGVHIGDGVRIDEEAVVLTHDVVRHLELDTVIGAGSYIGPRAIVMPGVSIGRGCVVLAGATVTRDVPDGAVVAGNPARIVSEAEAATG